MKRNTFLRTLAAVVLGSAALQIGAQGIYVNKKNGESISYPKAILDRVTPVEKGSSSATYETGAVATLKYEKIADMKTARIGHQIFQAGDGIVVVGGHTTGFQLTTTAEIYQNGQWRDLNISSPHDGGFSVTLSDGRVMVGGGFSSNSGVGQSKKVDIYNPSTQTFSAGPDLSVARAGCRAIAIGNKVYVSGNWYADDKVIDYYDGSSFTSIGDMDGRSNPYLFSDKEGNVYSLSAYDTRGGDFGFYTDAEGNKALSADKYDVTDGKTYYYRFPFFSQWVPVYLHADARVEDTHYIDDADGANLYLVLTKNGSDYLLTEVCPDNNKTYNYNKFSIPSKHPVTNATINYRGTVFYNKPKHEYYLIGTSGSGSNQTVHIISYCYDNGYWTIASASGFNHDLMSGAWTLLSDGRLACTGGGIKDNFDAQKYAYLFTPAEAGLSASSSSHEYGVNVYRQDGNYDYYTESDLESITTYEEEFDEKIVKEIPVEMLTQLGQYMPIYSGSTPPSIEGTYRVAPNRYVYDTTGYFNENKPTATDKIIRFSNQQSNGQEVDYAAYDAGNADIAYGNGAIVIGSGNNFTAFFNTEMTDSKGIYVKQATLVSGTITSQGIQNLYRSFLTTDKRGDDNNNTYMAVGAFRTFKDGDGLASNETWSPGSKARMKDGKSSSDALPSDIMVPGISANSQMIVEVKKR